MISKSQIDTARGIDLLALAERYTSVKHVATSAGGEYAGPCPVCGGRDRFRVQPLAHRWLCRYCTQGKWQDAIALYQAVHRLTFAEAVEGLAGASLPDAPANLEPTIEPLSSGPPNAAWQMRAKICVAEAEHELWGEQGQRARAWLNARGLADGTLQRWHIGLVTSPRRERAPDWGLTGKAIYLDRGILIPALVADTVWYLKIRRATGEPKYVQVRGSRPALFMAETLSAANEACITEGEFDAMLLWQCLQQASNLRWHSLGVATLGSQSNRINLDDWARYLYHLKHIAILYDQDGQSETSMMYWRQIASRAHIVRWQGIHADEKDLTDFHLAGGRLLDLASWGIQQAEQAGWPPLPEAMTEFLNDIGAVVVRVTQEKAGLYRVRVEKSPLSVEHKVTQQPS